MPCSMIHLLCEWLIQAGRYFARRYRAPPCHGGSIVHYNKMRGHGSLQQLLGKRVASKKKSEQDETTNSTKRQRASTGSVATPEPSTTQPKLYAFFKAQQPGKLLAPTAPKPRQVADKRASPYRTAHESQQLAPVSFTVHTRVVGRRHQDTADQAPPFVASELLLLREPDNPVDPASIKVCTRGPAGHLRTHGHLPASVSAHLAPLLDLQQISLRAELVPTPVETGRELLQQQMAAERQLAAEVADRGGYTELPTEPSVPTDSSGMPIDSKGAAGGSRGSSALTRMGSGMWKVEIRVVLSSNTAADASGAAAVTAAVELAAAAGSESLEPGKNSGAVLSAAFQHILQQTRQHDFHLLEQQEQDLLHSMQALTASARSLLLRLLLRKRRWYELSSLAYSEVPDVAAAASALRGAGLVVWSVDDGADLESLLPELPVVLLKAVLARVLPRNHPAVVAGSAAAAVEGKAALVSSIQGNACQVRLQSAISAAVGDWLLVLPAVVDTFLRLQHIYFLNQGQDLGMFLAVDRGVLRYPPYCVRRSRPVFASRQCLLEYEAALQLAAQLDKALEDDSTDLAWQILQPALKALQAGSHKNITWSEQHGATVPNTPPAVQQQQPLQQHWEQQNQRQQQQQRAQQYQQQVQQEHRCPAPALPDIQSPRHRSPSSNSFSRHHHHLSSRASRSRSRSPSPSSNSEAASDGEADSAASCSSSHSSSRGMSQTSTPVSTSSARRPSRQTPAPPSVVRTRQTSAAAIAAAATSVPASEPNPAAAATGWPAGEPETATCEVSTAAPLFLARFCAGWVHGSLGTVAVSLLEKQKRWSDAVDLLRLLLGGNACVGRRGEWWERLAINLEHQGLPEQALEAVEAALADSWVRGGDLLGLQRRCLRLGKPPRRWRRPSWSGQAEWEPRECSITGRPLNCNTGSKSRFYGLDGSQVTVEELALQHYASAEAGCWQGMHSEGGVWGALFGLLLWDVLFMDVPDVFRSPFQVAPLDLDSDAFYPARREQLDKLLTRIADGEAGSILSRTWSTHHGLFCRGVNWQRFTQGQLLDICNCVGGLGLAAVLRLMAEDHAGATGGLPDLLLWRTCDSTAKAVEVKGPRDRLSNQQRFWLAHMANSNIQVEVCKVKEPSNSSRK